LICGVERLSLSQRSISPLMTAMCRIASYLILANPIHGMVTCRLASTIALINA
jgi:hypothetical protein